MFLPTRGERIGGVITVPDDPTSDLAVVMMSGRARDRAHRNGMWVRTSAGVAQKGAYALRLDYPGVGNSTGEPAVFPLEHTPWWAVVDAVRFLTQHTPVRRVVLVGTCFGARVMLDAAPMVPECISVGYICGPVLARTPTIRWRVRQKVRAVLRRGPSAATGPRNEAQQKREGNLVIGRRVSPAFKRSLTKTMQSVKLHFLFGDEDFVYDEMCFAIDSLHPSKDRYEMDVIPGVLHTFQTLDDQAVVEAWVPKLTERILAGEDT